MKKWTLHRVHKWAGLFAALWLAVLGITGFILDHRDQWAWLWQNGVNTSFVNEEILHEVTVAPFKVYQLDPDNLAQRVTGGQTGLWWSEDAGKKWQASRFENSNTTPQVYTAVYSASHLWIATDNGLWLSRDNGRTASLFGLSGIAITAITQGSEADTLLAVAERSSVIRINSLTKEVHPFRLSPLDRQQLPDAISLSRFVRDLHYGRGVFAAPLSLLWNDAAGIAMLLIPLSGVLFFILPRYWRRKKQQGIEIDHLLKKNSMRWLFRLHAPLLGLITFIPILYLSVTGIMLDHGKDLMQWMKQNNVSRAWQTPVYDMQSLDGEIYSILGYQGQANRFSIGTRLGLFTTDDKGVNWRREKLLGDKSWFIWSLVRDKEQVFIGGMGGPNLYQSIEQPQWQPVKNSGHMPSDVVFLNDANWLIKTRHGLLAGSPAKGFDKIQASLPQLDYVPWYYFIDGLHTGMLIHAQWKWINDLFAILAMLLVITGLVRWWHKKWI